MSPRVPSTTRNPRTSLGPSGHEMIAPERPAALSPVQMLSAEENRLALLAPLSLTMYLPTLDERAFECRMSLAWAPLPGGRAREE